MITRGELAADWVGSRRARVRRSDLDAFLAAGETDKPEPTVADREEVRAALAGRWTAFAARSTVMMTPSLRRRCALSEAADRLARAVGA